MTNLHKLVSLASESLSQVMPVATDVAGLPLELGAMLRSRNGFTAFESALVVFPLVHGSDVPGIRDWNDLKGWRRHYLGVIGDDCVCFAQDLFGLQFVLSRSGVLRFDPECGGVSHYAKSLEDWAKQLLQNYEEDTAWPLAHEWQLLNGVLPPNMRLLPKLPFVLGGDYEADNLIAVECTQAMEFWAKLFEAIGNVPDGQSVTLDGWLC